MSIQSQTVQTSTPVPSKKSIFWIGRKRREQMGKVLAFSMLCILGFLYFFPFYWTLITALKTDVQVFQWPPTFYAPTPQWNNFVEATNYIPFWSYMRNTFVICFFAIFGTLVSTTLVAYGFSRINFRGRDILFLIYLSTIMLPGQVTMIPLYILYSKLGWVGSILPLVVPTYFGSVAYVFMLRQFFRTIPNELSDAAFMDGANDLQILWQIMLPLCRPALATIALLSFIGNYQDFLGPLVYLTNQDQWTIAIGLNMFKNMFSTQYQLMMAASTLSMLPMLILYFFTQRTLIQGITLTGIKG
jgi:multiple sugar transport system permease protein